MRRIAIVLVLGLATTSVPAAADHICTSTPRPSPSDPVLAFERNAFGFHDEELLLCSDADGVPIHLAARLWVPAGCNVGACPAVVIAHGFGFNKEITMGDMLNAVDRGMVVLSYDVRGQGASGGQATLLGPEDVRDQAAVLAWLHREVNPTKVGLYGLSQGGALAWMGAIYNCGSARAASFDSTIDCDEGERWVDAIAPLQGPTTLSSFDDGTCLVFAVQAVPYSRGNPTLAAENVRCLSSGTPAEGITEVVPGPALDLSTRDVLSRVDRIDVPVYVGTSFNDRLVPPQTITDMYEALDARADYDEDLRMIISNDGHGDVGANFAVLDDIFEWMAWALAGVGEPRDARVAIAQEWAGDAFRLEDGWPVAGSTWMRYLADAGALADAPSGEAEEMLNVPVLESPPSGPFMGGLRLSSADGTPGVRLTYRTDEAAETYEITGVPSISLWVSGTGRGQLHVALSEVTPDGEVLEFARARTGLRDLTSTPVRVDLRFNATAYRIDQGDRLMVSITPSDVGVAVPERGTDSVFVHHDATYPSMVELPLVPTDRSQPAGDPPSGSSFADDPMGAICAFFGGACP